MFRMNCVDDTIWLVGPGRTCEASQRSTPGYAGLLCQASDAIPLISCLSIQKRICVAMDMNVAYAHIAAEDLAMGMSNDPLHLIYCIDAVFNYFCTVSLSLSQAYRHLLYWPFHDCVVFSVHCSQAAKSTRSIVGSGCYISRYLPWPTVNSRMYNFRD